jgi:two-component system chemotaxis response regulator CheY
MASAGGSQKHALVVDDSSTVRRVIGGFLSGLGFSVEEAQDGRAGLERLRAMPSPCLIVVDWNMPVLDGLGFIRALRAERRYDTIPLLMVTTEIDKQKVIDALRAGANEYVMKPFTTEMLAEKLQILGFSVPPK